MGKNYQKPIAEDVDEFGKVSYIQSRTHSDYDAAETIAHSDLEDGESPKMLASPLYIQGQGIMNPLENQQLQGNGKQ